MAKIELLHNKVVYRKPSREIVTMTKGANIIDDDVLKDPYIIGLIESGVIVVKAEEEAKAAESEGGKKGRGKKAAETQTGPEGEEAKG